jgi:hypothetical protein
MPRKKARLAPDQRSGCPMRWWPSSPRGCLAGRPELREYFAPVCVIRGIPVQAPANTVSVEFARGRDLQ